MSDTERSTVELIIEFYKEFAKAMVEISRDHLVTTIVILAFLIGAKMGISDPKTSYGIFIGWTLMVVSIAAERSSEKLHAKRPVDGDAA